VSHLVVFDNNAYKDAGPDRIAEIVEREKQLGVTALASVAVVQELLARVRDPNERERGRNRAAVRKLASHCRADRDGRPIINFVSHTECQIFRLFMGHSHSTDAGVFDDLGAMIGAVVESDRDDPLKPHNNYLGMIEANVAKVEHGYVEQLKSLAAEEVPLDQSRMRRNLDYAEKVIRVSEQLYGVSYGDGPAIVQRIMDVAKLTSLGFALSDHVATTVKERRGGFAQHKNTAWDVEIVSATSIYTTINGEPIVVVTHENMLLEVAAKEGLEERVMNLESYERLLGIA
jgi:hypothetical protein